MKIIFTFLMMLTTLLANYQAPMSVKGSTHIDSQKAYQLFLQGVKFIDVRPVRFIKQGKIKNAYHLYEGDLTQKTLQKIAKTSEEIVIYCNGSGCSLSAEAILKAVSYGYKKVYYYRDGYPAWEYYKLPKQ